MVPRGCSPAPIDGNFDRHEAHRYLMADRRIHKTQGMDELRAEKKPEAGCDGNDATENFNSWPSEQC